MVASSDAVVNSILALSSLVPQLSQNATNGASVLGLLSAPQLSTTGVDGIVSWGSKTVSNYNPYSADFNSGRQGPTYNFDITRGFLAPDGVNRSVVFVNGQFPGPMIEANYGDTITVNVCNKITGPEDGASIHWHGILQKSTPWYDGVPGNAQCPIAPGTCMTYAFLADVYGTSWWHSHYGAQYAGGVSGPMIIHGPSQVAYDHDIGPVMLTDWYHQPYEQIVDFVMASPPQTAPPLSNSNLINGKMSLDCLFVNSSQQCTSNAGLSKFQFHSGETYRLRLINHGAEGTQRFTIDGHNMTVFANDFVPVVPYTTNMVTLGVGQRTDVIVTATGAPNSTFWMRADLSQKCAAANTTAHHALAAIYYEDADTNSVPHTTATVYDDSICGNDNLTLTTPYYAYPATTNPAVTQTLTITDHSNATATDPGVQLFYVNNQTFRADYNAPILPLAIGGNFSYPNPDWAVYNFNANSSVRLIVYNEFIANHPMHLHGHNFNVLAQGVGIWDGVITHPQNTQRRDTQLVQGGSASAPGYIVLQYQTDNPGSWPFHCHIAWHVSAGLYINTIEQDAKLEQRVLPSVVADTCKSWDAYSASNVVDQIDSGEKRMFARDFSLKSLKW